MCNSKGCPLWLILSIIGGLVLIAGAAFIIYKKLFCGSHYRYALEREGEWPDTLDHEEGCPYTTDKDFV